MATSDQVQQLYITYFGRPADPSGLAFWTADSTTPLATIANGFATTPEFAADITGRTLDQVVNSFYVDLFGRNAEPAGLAFWVNQIQIGNTTIQQAGLEISNAALTQAAAGNSDNVALLSKIAAAAQWTATTAASTAATLAYSGELGITAGVSYLQPVLTTETIPSQAATDAQLAALIQANGGGTGSTLELSIFGDVVSDQGTVRLDANGSIQSTSPFRFTSANQTVNGTAGTFSGALLADRLTDGFTTDQDVLNLVGFTTTAGLTGAVGAGGPATVANIENINVAFNSVVTGGATNLAYTGVQSFSVSGSVADGNAPVLNIANTGATAFTSTLTGDNTSSFNITVGAGSTVTTSDIIDIIVTGNGSNVVVSGGGADTVTTGTGADSVDGGDGADTITTNAGNDTVIGGNGFDTITTGAGADSVTAGAGNDTVTGGTGADFIDLGAGSNLAIQNAGDSVAASAAALSNNPLTSGWFANGSTITFANGVDVITGQTTQSRVGNTITLSDSLTFADGNTYSQLFIGGAGGVGGGGSAAVAAAGQLLPAQLIASDGSNGFFDTAGAGGLATTAASFFVQGSWNGTAFTASTTGEDLLIFNVANGGYNGVFTAEATAEAFFTNYTSAVILDA